MVKTELSTFLFSYPLSTYLLHILYIVSCIFFLYLFLMPTYAIVVRTWVPRPLHSLYSCSSIVCTLPHAWDLRSLHGLWKYFLGLTSCMGSPSLMKTICPYINVTAIALLVSYLYRTSQHSFILFQHYRLTIVYMNRYGFFFAECTSIYVMKLIYLN